MIDINNIGKAIKKPKIAKRYFQRQILHRSMDYSVAVNSKISNINNVFNRDWDVLIILDTARVDTMEEVKSEYKFIRNIQKMWTIGGHSAEWIANTFDNKYLNQIEKTAYISSNPHVESVLENRLKENWDSEEYSSNIQRLKEYGSFNLIRKEDIGKYEPIWKYNNGSEHRYGNPRCVTDRGIAICNKNVFDRVILHYMAPHQPYVSKAIEENRDLHPYESSPFEYLRNGGDKEKVINSYKDMLRWILEEIRIVLNNINSDNIVITSDHGEAFGEYGIYNHHAGSLHPHVRYVPWIETKGENSGSYEPSIDLKDIKNENESTIEEQLKSLGYL